MHYLVFIGITLIWLLPMLFLELARDALNAEGYCVIGGYMSPVNDAYKKGVCSCLYHIDRNVICRVAFVSKWMSFTFYTFLKTLKQMASLGSELQISISPGLLINFYAWICNYLTTLSSPNPLGWGFPMHTTRWDREIKTTTHTNISKHKHWEALSNLIGVLMCNLIHLSAAL